MLRRRLLNINNGANPAAQPIFHVDCDGNNIDIISGLPAEAFPGQSDIIYVADPTNSTRQCAMKVSGANKILAVQPMALPDNKPFFLAANQTANSGIELFDTFRGGGNRLEFMVYVVNDGTIRALLMTGDIFAWWNGQNGVDIGVYNTQIQIHRRNNNTVNEVTNLISLSSVTNKWTTIQYDVKELSSTSFSVVVKILDNGALLASAQFLQTKPLVNAGRVMILFGSHYGYGQWYENPIDMLKDVKIYKEQDLTDFSIYQ